MGCSRKVFTLGVYLILQGTLPMSLYILYLFGLGARVRVRG